MEIRVTADILENEDGDLLLAFHVQDGQPEEPRLSFNGEEATLHRSHNQDVMLGTIHKAVRTQLSRAKQILVTEVGPEGIVNGYFAPVGLVH